MLEIEHHYLDPEVHPNTNKVKKFIGKILSKIILQLYELIRDSARNKNIYTDEIRYDSKAGYLLLRDKFDFMDKDVMWKELLIFILNTPKTSKYRDYIKGIEPLDLDIALLGDYLQVFSSNVRDNIVLDEIEHLYSEAEFSIGDRLNGLDIIGHQYANFSFDEDEDEDGIF